jgi:exosortase B
VSAVIDRSGSHVVPPRAPIVPTGFDWPIALLLVAGFACLYVPSYLTLSGTIWVTDEQGHGPIILAVSFWLLYSKRHDIAAAPTMPLPWLAWPLLLVALLLYAFGRSQDIIMFEIGSQILLLAALILLFKGAAALRVAWFPLFFMIFMVPLPGALVAAATAPLKNAVSTVVTSLLYGVGYPISRTGVMLMVGQYQLLVADACAGLNSMFTLEALGMLYMNIMRYTSVPRNVALAILLIPTAFVANIVRVCILVLVTYHFGDEAGQGFVHGFAGMVLFLSAMVMMLVLDKMLNLFFPAQRGAA